MRINRNSFFDAFALGGPCAANAAKIGRDQVPASVDVLAIDQTGNH